MQTRLALQNYRETAIIRHSHYTTNKMLGLYIES